MKFRKLAVVTLLAFSLVSCGQAQEPTTESGENQDVVAEDTAEKTIIDREGNELVIPAEVNSIISLAPSITETLIDLGLGDKIVGIDTYSAEEVGLSEDVVQFDILAPDVETIATLQPDMIFVSGMSKATSDDPLAAAKDLGITVTYIPTSNSLAGIKEDITFLGEATHTTERAAEINADFDARIAEINEKIATVDAEPRTVYFEIGPSPNLYSFGKGVFLDEILTMLNTTNIFGEQESWIAVTEEEIFARNPQVIFTNTYLEDPITELVARDGWNSLDAVKNNQVFQVDIKTSSQANEFVVLAIEEMAKALYPDLFN